VDDYRRRAALRICDHYRRGIFTAEEACLSILTHCVEPAFVEAYLRLLPDDLRAILTALLPKLPTNDEGWAAYERMSQLDGDEWSWTRMIVEFRSNTEAARMCLLGEYSPPAGADFIDRVRVAFHERLEEFDRSNTRRQKNNAD
jgi:hypothetical protein